MSNVTTGADEPIVLNSTDDLRMVTLLFIIFVGVSVVFLVALASACIALTMRRREQALQRATRHEQAQRQQRQSTRREQRYDDPFHLGQ